MGAGQDAREQLGNRRKGRLPNSQVKRTERGLGLQRKAQSLKRFLETHQINNYIKVERADSIY